MVPGGGFIPRLARPGTPRRGAHGPLPQRFARPGGSTLQKGTGEAACRLNALAEHTMMKNYVRYTLAFALLAAAPVAAQQSGGADTTRGPR